MYLGIAAVVWLLSNQVCNIHTLQYIRKKKFNNLLKNKRSTFKNY